MKRIYKYALQIAGEEQRIVMPKTSTVLHVECVDGASINLWAEVNNIDVQYERRFRVYATGQGILSGGTYVGTVFQLPFVWHVYEY